ncbi:Histidine kinase [Alteripontixanthobacter maritimus]|uniref:Sensory/regulatory protein RpfC n=1 Tax=Alteripontixanthobacter maritimus TaxID=2161824 RepID=A0A369QBM1_9SPHN|nr:MASE1 domain-containing protein [Alteripontixanthobacter maritimus]RDC60627.1 Histidine kinase [Alteripontixanthobacter maritimus]
MQAGKEMGSKAGRGISAPIALSAPKLAAAALAGGAVFGLLAYLGIDLTRGEGRFAAVWLPNAIAVAFLLRVRLKGENIFLAALWLGNVSANLVVGDSIYRAAGLASCNSVEIIVALALTRRVISARPDMRQIGDLAWFSLAAGIVAPMISATLATMVLASGAGVNLGNWARWALADGLGMIVIAPTILVIGDALRHPRIPSPGRMIEWAVITLAGILVTCAVFFQSTYPLLFLIGPVMLAHAFRLGVLGTAFAIINVAVIASLATVYGYGPITLVEDSLGSQLLTLQGFVASSFLVGLPVAAVLHRRRAILKDLRDREALLSMLTDNITDAVIRYDSNRIATYASPSARDVLGRDPEDLLDKTANGDVHEDSHGAISDVLERLYSGEVETERFTFRRLMDGADGKPQWLEADCATTLDADTGKVSGLVVSARNVTHRVELEAQLIRARRHAENAAQSKSQFLANMSHEIRTPMNGVLGFADLLLKSDLGTKEQEYADLIFESGNTMMALLNDILDVSKIEAGQIVITDAAVDLEHLLDGCLKLHTANARSKGLELILDWDSSLPPRITTDPLRLRQIVLNLLGNAIKFTEKGRVVLSARPQDQLLTIKVTDSGIGIPEDRLDDIFRPFEQADGATSRRYGGTGLGLTISRQLAGLLGGTLDAESRNGRGSVFALTLPLVEADTGAAMLGADAPTHQADTVRGDVIPTPGDEPYMDENTMPRANILLAEDHDINRMLVCAMLERCGQYVTIAENGNQAIAAIADARGAGEPFDLVLMDIQMPECDGYDATRAIRAAGISPQELPIIALTANAFPEDVAATKAVGMQAHLAKPLVFQDLVTTLQRWLPTRIIEEAELPRRRYDDLPIPAVKHGPGNLSQPNSGNPPLSTKPKSGGHSPAGPAAHDALQEKWHQRRAEALDAVADAIRTGTLEGVDLDALASTIHKLAGTAGMFGETELGEKAAALERALRAQVSGQVRRQLAEELLQAA